ncbi:hypothetical protein BC829DRAFT_402336 [Chytridium lagenaria]|nr:hypothetical protein BC829DRAFT_402336 [Chytridium lagenaria]
MSQTVEIAAELGYLCAQFGNGFAFVLFTFSMVIVWTYRRKASVPYQMIFYGCFFLNIRIFVGMIMTFLKDTQFASKSILNALGFAKDFFSIVRSFPIIFLLITNAKAYLMVKWRDIGVRLNVWIWTWVMWSIINIPWYVGVQIARATGDPQIKSTGQLLVFITFAIYSVLAVTSEFMYIKMIWEMAKIRECKPFMWILNVCEFFLYTSILSFTMGNISRLLQYLTARDPTLPAVYSQIINAFGADLAEAPFMMAVSFSMVILTNSLRNAEITFLNQFSDRVATDEDREESWKTVLRVSRGGSNGAVIWS